MSLKIDAKSLLWGVVIGLAVIFAVGAVHNPGNAGQYQLTMAANETYVFYGRMHTGTGQIETWRYVTSTVPAVRDEKILLQPDLKSQAPKED